MGMGMGMSEKELGGLRALHGETCRSLYVEVDTEAPVSQEQCRQLVSTMLGECRSLKKVVLEFKTKQSDLFTLEEFLARLDERETFPELKYFEVAGVKAPRMVKPLGLE